MLSSSSDFVYLTLEPFYTLLKSSKSLPPALMTKYHEALEKGCLPFFVNNRQVGLIRPDFWVHFKNYPDVFQLVEKPQGSKKPGVHLSEDYKDYKERTAVVSKVLEELRAKDAIGSLRGWRDENYSVKPNFAEQPLLEVERSASGLFGLLEYGVHINGFTRSAKGELKMWIGRRSKTKQTFPDMLDNMCAGGLPAGMGVLECARKECQEEANVSDQLLDRLKPVGCISYFYEDERGLQPESQFIFDLELPEDFTPVNTDGEMGSFQLLTMSEIQTEIVSGNFKPNCAAVCLDFLIRHSFIDFDTDPNLMYFVEQMHAPLQSMYR
ncbi:hypothetical protein EGW08_020768 [Elysia chlorotica]|uniref:Nudix hydrolase domain-containing protein n=1 Tax=Elysia chlorotica TaxID=188477 RepID=A0A3S0Z815_ELYCH|nr:hypothetical protein EGW08_020768 [Elysia chlorotica]